LLWESGSVEEALEDALVVCQKLADMGYLGKMDVELSLMRADIPAERERALSELADVQGGSWPWFDARVAAVRGRLWAESGDRERASAELARAIELTQGLGLGPKTDAMKAIVRLEDALRPSD